jgi:hypothetical protein
VRRTAWVVLLGLPALVLPVATASAQTSAVTCGDHWTQRPEGPSARDYAWGNCTGRATSVKVYSLTYGGTFRNLLRTDCVAAGRETALGSTTDWRVLSYTGEDTGTAC